MTPELIMLLGENPGYAGSWQDVMVDAILRDTGKKTSVKIVNLLNEAYIKASKYANMTEENLHTYMAASAKLPPGGEIIAEAFIQNIDIKNAPPPPSVLSKIGSGFMTFAFIAAIAAGAYMLSQVNKFR